MKKTISIMLSIVMILAVAGFSTISAFAVPVNSIETTVKGLKVEITVDNHVSLNGSYTVEEGESTPEYKHVIIFHYTGDDPLDYWEIRDLVLNVDYVILEEDDGTLKIAILKDDIDFVSVNAVTKRPEESTQNTTNTVKDVDHNKTSPKTGVTTGAIYGVALVGMGATALIKKSKKK